ncbi:cyclin-J-like protein [Python bivittatus]|uniref:Cyclin-J-like protein n=1 Tax=Python bivittatus TaxID=176946 RepID=A0A9F5IV94_PYTBI|nr:cyclin-J-like protein [Python bivittatus]
MGSLRMEEPWWKGDLAADVHQTLRLKELKLPVYKAHSPQIERRRYFAHLLTVLSSRCQLCPTARHLAIYLLDLFMDRYDVTVKQLYVISVACLLLASKFEEKEDKVPKLELLNNFAYMCSLNLALTKKDLLKMELLLLESFNWNLCLPTPAHYIDYYLFASVSEGDLHKGWPITSVTKFRAIMEKYSHSFLEASLQDHVFLSFRPSVVAAACVGASRIYLEISPSWTTQLQLLTCYSWEHLAPCIELMLGKAHSKDPREAPKEKDCVTLLQQQQQQVMESLTLQTPTQVLFQQPQYHPLAQPSAVLSQFCSPIQDLCSAYRDSLQAPRPSGLTSGNSVLHTYSALQENFQPVLQTVSIQGPITMQVAISTESRHCLSLIYGSSYFSRHHSYAAGCFDG